MESPSEDLHKVSNQPMTAAEERKAARKAADQARKQQQAQARKTK